MGKPSVMVAIPKFYLDEVIDGASHTIHPAFIINGVEQDVIYISKYQNIVENERAYSLPMESPTTNVTFDAAWNYCKNKGAGWHLMTNAEWAAVALLCKKNNIFPKGNNDYGKNISETNLPSKAIAASYDSSKKVNKSLTGSGPENWYHDGTFAGIADLNGNVWEWISGMRLINGKIQILENNNAADYNNSVFADSALWKEIMPNGSLVAPGTTGTLAYSTSCGSALFTSLTTTPSAAGTGAALLEALGLLPHENSNPADYGNHAVWVTVEGEKVPLRGGAWYNTTLAGIFTLMLGYERSYNNVVNGFRCAYYGSIA
ncbi:MAG: formylglycine-generating enzyme family protein [Ruminococcus sp.]|nr:formylglycine-generating enzyme family protein [Ruminococcus sp.]